MEAAESASTPVVASNPEIKKTNPRTGERKCLLPGTSARFYASDPTKETQCQIQVIRGAYIR